MKGYPLNMFPREKKSKLIVQFRALTGYPLENTRPGLMNVSVLKKRPPESNETMLSLRKFLSRKTYLLIHTFTNSILSFL